MNNIKQLMNSLILCHVIWSYLILSSQLELPPIQSLLYLSGNNLRQPNINHIRSLNHNFLLHPTFFQTFPTKNPTSLNVIGLNSIVKSSFLTILQQIGPIFWNFKILILIHLSKKILTPQSWS